MDRVTTKTWFKFRDPTAKDKAFPMWGYGTAIEAATYAEMDGVIFVEMESRPFRWCGSIA